MEIFEGLLNIISKLDEAGKEQFGSTSGVSLVATPWCTMLSLHEQILWDSEDDRRVSCSENETMYSESVEEYVLTQLEKRGKELLAIVERVRNPLPEETEESTVQEVEPNARNK